MQPTLPSEEQVKDHRAGAHVVAGQIFIDSEETEGHTEDEENLRSQEEQEATLEDLDTLELSLNKDLEEVEVQKPGSLLHIIFDLYLQSLKM